jgi:hypothetical protein
MSSDAQILETVQQAFAKRPRPLHFTNHTHCDECAEHDEVLRSRDVETLGIDDVGNPGWDPICFVSSEGFAYYLPALVRLTLAPLDALHGWYGNQLLFHLCSDGPGNRRVLACTPEERRSVVELLQHIVDTRAELADSNQCSDQLFRAIEYWSDESSAAS